MDNLHDAGTVLENGDFGALMHLQCSIQETVDRDSSVAIDAAQTKDVSRAQPPQPARRASHQDDLADANIPLGPRRSFVFD